MNSTAWTADLLAGSLQTALLLAIGLALPYVFRLRHPGFCLRYWRGLLLGMLLLPLSMFWHSAPQVLGDLALETPWFTDAIYSAPTKALPALSSQLLFGLLSLGIGLRLAWLLMGLAALSAQRRRARPFSPRLPAMDRAERLLGVQVRFLSSPQVEAPVTFGFRRPVVLLPPRFRDLSPKAQESVLCHELLHVRRNDWCWVVGEGLLRALLWFHPGVWILLGRISLSREQLIDHQVIRLLKHRRPYLEALRTFACGPWPATSPAAAAFLNRGHLMQRVTLLTQEVSMSHRRIAFSTTALATILAITAVVAPALFPWSAAVSDRDEVLGGVELPSFLASDSAPGEGEEILYVEGEVMKPVRLEGDAPTYPQEAKKDRTEGPVVVQTVIDLQGTIESMQFKESLGPAFEKSVKQALATWRFKPATLHGQPVKVYYVLTINFRLDSGQPAASDA